MKFFSSALLIFICTSTSALEFVTISGDGKSFILSESKKPFVPWGFNYDRDYKRRLIEEYWEAEWETVATDFRTMKQLGANVVRVHLQFEKFMEAPGKPNASALKRLEKLVGLAEELGIYLDVTGLSCYRLKDQPEWYAQMNEKERWAAQAAFWESIAKCCAGRPGVMAFDLVNEPVVGNKLAPGKWVHEAALGGFHYVQFIALDSAGRDGEKLWQDWAHTLVTAIRKHDPKRLITVGLLPLPNPATIQGVGAEVDYMSVHLYPKSGKLDELLVTLKKYAIGKPLIIEEYFPMESTIQEGVEFVEKTKGTASGWITFYWGRPLAELKASKEIGDQIQSAWLEQFRKTGASLRGE